ncbi:MAG: hypothetical protein Tsb0020_39360 [Haliangiales bacterium]
MIWRSQSKISATNLPLRGASQARSALALALTLALALLAAAGCGDIVPIDPDGGLGMPDADLTDGRPSVDATPRPDAGLSPNNANLSELSLSAPLPLTPAFDPGVTDYTVEYSLLVQEVRVRATAENPAATVRLLNDDSVLDADVPSAPIALPAEGQALTVEVTAADGVTTRTYSIQADRQSAAEQYLYVKSPAPDAGDQFGKVMASSGDTLVVGAPFEDSAASGVDGDVTDNTLADSGAVFVYRRVGNSWEQQAYLKASNSDADDQFGDAVAIDGDFIVVGAQLEDSSATGVDGDQASDGSQNSGAAYVFRREGDSWVQDAYLKSLTPDVNDRFGASVAISGTTIAISARFEDSTATGVDGDATIDDPAAAQSGAVYIFERGADGWAQTHYIKPSTVDVLDEFGFRVALDGDRLAVAAPFEDSVSGANQADNTAFNSGAVFIFGREGDTWAQEAYLKAGSPGGGDATAGTPGDLFGFSLALQGDTLVIGAALEDSDADVIDGDETNNAAADAGAVYVFVRGADGSWNQQAYIKASNSDTRDQFGVSVQMRGELMAVGANGEGSGATGVGGDQGNNNAGFAGAVYLYRRVADSWSQEAYIKSSNTQLDDGFGFGAALSRDTLIVGAPFEDNDAAGIGANQSGEGAGNSGALYLLR